jgi:ChrR Cupin-like domain
MHLLRTFCLTYAVATLPACDDPLVVPLESLRDASATASSADAAPTASSADAAPDASDGSTASAFTTLDLDDVKTNPENYDWFEFKPNVQKLILAGAPETEHIAILWYTVQDGAVGLHYHSLTESVYVIDGTQTDAKGEYETGTVYFNPPGSGHAISDSSGFFVLAYAAPPDFAATDLIEEYTPVKIATDDAELTSDYAFEEVATDVLAYDVPLASEGGMTAKFIDTGSNEPYTYVGNYLLIVNGSCEVNGALLSENMLVVTHTTVAAEYQVLAASASAPCLVMGVSF